MESLRLSGADAVVLGEVRSRASGLELEIRLVEVASGKVLSSLSRTLPNGVERKESDRIARELVAQSLD